MSNISQASKELKKKLSFKDYNAPAEQHEAVHASQQVLDQVPVGQLNVLDDKAVSQYVGDSKPLKQYNKSKKEYENTKKIKATFYLSEEDNQLLTDMFIKRLQEKNKTDKSALMVEALRLLYKREMK